MVRVVRCVRQERPLTRVRRVSTFRLKTKIMAAPSLRDDRDEHVREAQTLSCVLARLRRELEVVRLTGAEDTFAGVRVRSAEGIGMPSFATGVHVPTLSFRAMHDVRLSSIVMLKKRKRCVTPRLDDERLPRGWPLTTVHAGAISPAWPMANT